MKTLLINAPSPFLIDQKAFVPLGLLYIAAMLEKHGKDVTVADLSGQEDNLEDVLKRYTGYDLYGISASTPQYYHAKIIKDIIRQYNPDAKIIIGGSHPSSLPDQCVNDGFDIAVAGEGENAVLQIINDMKKGIDSPSILKLPYVDDIDSLPYPARHLIDLKSYGYDLITGKAATVITSRGCPYNCAFCSKDVWENSLRFHSADRVVNEIKEIIEKYNMRNFLFLDDAINLIRKRIVDLCDQLKPLGIKWRCYARVSESTDREVLLKMKDAGCEEIGLGIESGSQKILDNVNKKTNVEKNAAFIALCQEAGIQVNVFLMIGLPGETRETVEETKKWIEKVKPDKFGFNIFMPYVGTPIYKNPENYDIKFYPMDEKHSWVKGHFDEMHSYVETTDLSRKEILDKFKELFAYYTDILAWNPGVGKK